MELINDFRVALPVERAWEVLTDVERIAPCMPGAQLQEVEGDEYRGIVKVKVGPITAQYKGQATFVERDEAGRRAVLRAEGRETRGQGSASATITATLTPEPDGTAVRVVTDLTVTGKVAQFGRGVLADVSANLLGQFVQCLETTILAGDPAAGAATGAAGPPPTDAPAEATGAAEPPPTDAPAEATSAAGPPPTDAPSEATGAAGPPPTDAPSEATGAAEPSVAQEQASPTDAPVVAPAAASDPEPPAATPEPATGPRKIDMPEPAPVDLVSAAGTPVAKRVGPIVGVVAIAWLLRVLLRRRRR